jgi:hypothetical protein
MILTVLYEALFLCLSFHHDSHLLPEDTQQPGLKHESFKHASEIPNLEQWRKLLEENRQLRERLRRLTLTTTFLREANG